MNRPFRVKAVLFDFDGTLTKPGVLDFSGFKKVIDCPADRPVLEFIASVPDGAERERLSVALERFEMDAAALAEPNQGAEALIRYLRAKDLHIGIISRNCLKSIKRSFQNFASVGLSDFDVIISRDTPVKPKPSNDGVLLAAERLGVPVEQMLMVGDYVFDMEAGRSAGAVTVFLDNRPASRSGRVVSDFSVSRLKDLKKIVRLGLPLPGGKLPNDLLGEFLDRFGFDDPSVLVHPGIGEDTAAVSVADEEVLVLKSDPITFATDSIGQYGVLVNANDIATAGAVPRWFLTTLMFPRGITASGIWHVMHELIEMCCQRGITLCGGHTEITDAVTRPVVTGMLTGTVSRRDLVDKRNMRAGDRVLFTKAVSVEGTAIIAREFGTRLKELGMSDTAIERCRRFLSHISILEEAQIATDSGGVTAMHDVTEGGLATALKELAFAGLHRIRVDMDQIPVFPETEKISGLLGIDPLGLIGSGSLLICCPRNRCTALMDRIRHAGIRVTCIGEVLEKGEGVEAVRQGRPAAWPYFEVDEITRLF